MPYAFIAAFTTAAVIGKARTRAPQALNIALPRAGAMTVTAGTRHRTHGARIETGSARRYRRSVADQLATSLAHALGEASCLFIRSVTE